MRKTLINFIALAMLAGFSFIVNADSGAGTATDTNKQFEHGNKMHTEHCFKCHTDEVYTRDNHFVKSLNALGKQVVRCKDNTGAPWFDEDTEAVVHFLNEKYYKF